MKVGVHGRALQYDGFGVETSTHELLTQWMRWPSLCEPLVLLPQTPIVTLRDGATYSSSVLKTGNSRGMFQTAWWDHVVVPRVAGAAKIDVLFCPLHVKPLMWKGPSVVQVHDMLYHLNPGEWGLLEGLYMRTAVSRLTTKATKIIADSSSTKHDIVRLLRVPSERIEVVHLGRPRDCIVLSTAEAEAGLKQFGLTKPFILMVASRHPRKNLARAVAAYDLLSKDFDHELVIVGPSFGIGPSRGELLMIAKRRSHMIKFFGLVKRSELISLYSKASVLFFPSTYEGFGLPILEAMACGCPVITSSTSSMPEVAGTAGKLVNPFSIGDLHSALHEVVSSLSLQQTMREQGTVQAAKFSWETAAQQMLRVFQGIVQ